MHAVISTTYKLTVPLQMHMEFWPICTGLPGCEHIVGEVVRLNKQECPKQRRKDCNCQPASLAIHGYMMPQVRCKIETRKSKVVHQRWSLAAICITSARCKARRSVHCAICSRQLKPFATIRQSDGAFRTAGRSSSSPMASDVWYLSCSKPKDPAMPQQPGAGV